MLKSFLLISLRTVVRNKIFTAINVSGLALGIGSCLLIWLVAHHEFQFDRFHKDAERIFRVVTFQRYTADAPEQLIPAVLPSFPQTLQASVPGIMSVAAYHLLGELNVQKRSASGQKIFNTRTAIVCDSNYFKIMNYEWIFGDPKNALTEPNTVVLTESRAHQYFGNISFEEMSRQTLIYDDSVQITVSGIVRDWTGLTDFPFTEFISLRTIAHGSWREVLQLDQRKGTPVTSQAFVKLRDNADPIEVSNMVSTLFEKTRKKGLVTKAALQPMRDIHFAETGEASTRSFTKLSAIYTFSAVAVFILLLAVINYINLTTAQSISRNKEIGIRKILGVSKMSLVLQFMAETLLISVAAVVLVWALLTPLLSVFGNVIPTGVVFDISDPETLLISFLMVIGTTILAGAWPAWALTKMEVSRIRKAAVNSSWGLRRSLIVFQFAISLTFIITAVFIGRQIHYMMGTDRGFNSEGVLLFGIDDRAHMERIRTLQSQFSNIHGVLAVARENIPPMGLDRAYTSIEFTKASEEPIQVAAIKADENFVPLYDIKILAGHNIRTSDTLREVLINESLARLLGFKSYEDAIGQQVGIWGKSVPISGVVSDFHQGDFHQPIFPQVIMGLACTEFVVKLDAKADRVVTIKRLEAEWKKFYPQTSIEAGLLNDQLGSLYNNEKTISWLINIATIVTIFISCIGLFGLTLYSIGQRVKEIGIRKVLGAASSGVVFLFVKDFLILIFFALLIASPIAGYLMKNWLANFAYRVNLSWWVFIACGLGCGVIATMTVGALCLKAANANPVDSLKND